jgi:hypothetical protein
MYYSDESSLGSCIWSTLVMGAVSYFSYKRGENNAYKTIEDKTQNERIQALESELYTMKQKEIAREKARVAKIRSDWGCKPKSS